MEFDDEIDHSILLTDDPFHPSAKKIITPFDAKMAWERFKSLVYHPDESGRPQGGGDFCLFWMGIQTKNTG